jgi:hypothetical protein
MVALGKGAQRQIGNYRMTLFGMYLLTMNGDPDKPEIAYEQRYFAIRKDLADHFIDVNKMVLFGRRVTRQIVALMESDTKRKRPLDCDPSPDSSIG